MGLRIAKSRLPRRIISDSVRDNCGTRRVGCFGKRDIRFHIFRNYLLLGNVKSGAAVTFIWKSLYFEFPKEIVINQVKVEFLTLTSGADDDIKITTNYGDATTTLGSVSFSGDGAVESKIFRTALKCNNFRVEVDTDESASTAGIVYARFIIDWDWSPTDR